MLGVDFSLKICYNIIMKGEKFMAKHIVKCLICEKTFDANIEPFVMKGRRYMHKACAEGKENEKSQEQKDIEALEEYIKKLFNENYVNARIKKQIKQFREEWSFTEGASHGLCSSN